MYAASASVFVSVRTWNVSWHVFILFKMPFFWRKCLFVTNSLWDCWSWSCVQDESTTTVRRLKHWLPFKTRSKLIRFSFQGTTCTYIEIFVFLLLMVFSLHFTRTLTGYMLQTRLSMLINSAGIHGQCWQIVSNCHLCYVFLYLSVDLSQQLSHPAGLSA